MSGQRSREEIDSILVFNLAFFATLAWLGSAAGVAKAGGWWYERGQMALAIAGMVLFWVAWWCDEQGRRRPALQLGSLGVAVLSVWVTSVHRVLL